MSYSEDQVMAAESLMAKYRGGADGEIGAALTVVGLTSERAAHEIAIRDDMIRLACRVGASLRQVAEASGLGRKAVTAIARADQAGEPQSSA